MKNEVNSQVTSNKYQTLKYEKWNKISSQQNKDKQ